MFVDEHGIFVIVKAQKCSVQPLLFRCFQNAVSHFPGSKLNNDVGFVLVFEGTRWIASTSDSSNLVLKR